MNRPVHLFSATLLAGAAALLALLGASSARAEPPLPRSDWRRADRPLPPQSPQNFAFELRFGPYYPEVDEEFSTDVGPYEQAFGDGAQFYFGLELDWQAVRIPYVGAVGPGFGWGYTRTSAPARISEGSERAGEESGEETSLTIMPMHASLVLRADELMRRTGFPLVAYGKAGFGFATWRAGAGDETAVADGVEGSGLSTGLHLAVGGMFALNILDARAAAQLDHSAGVNHSYLFFEWMKADLDGFGSATQMHVGTSTWIVGLALDM